MPRYDKFLWALISLMCMMVSVACGTQRNAVSTDSVPQTNNTKTLKTFDHNQFLKKVNANKTDETALSAKIKCRVQMDDNGISTTGQLKMKKDDFVQISLLDPVLGIMELVRIEFDRQNMLIIDRYNKRYINVPYSQVEFLNKCDIDFNTLQNLFWNYIFVPDKTGAKEDDLKFQAADGGEPKEGKDVYIKYIDQLLTYAFTTDWQTGRLNQTVITGNKDKNSKFAFIYEDFNEMKGKMFPNKMVMQFVMDNKNASLTFELSNIKNKMNKVEKTQVPTKYTKADPEKIFNEIIRR